MVIQQMYEKNNFIVIAKQQMYEKKNIAYNRLVTLHSFIIGIEFNFLICVTSCIEKCFVI